MRVLEREKRFAAETAADLVRDGMRVGLGTGTTVAYFLEALGRRRCRIECVATSPRTHHAAVALGLTVVDFDRLDRLDLAVDSADQIAADGWLLKGGGGAHTREKIVAASADRFVVIVDSSKLVDQLTGPVPVELASFGLGATLRRLSTAVVRDAPPSPDGGVLADYHCGVVDAPSLARFFGAAPGVVAHGLFAPELVRDVLVGSGDEVTHTTRGTP